MDDYYLTTYNSAVEFTEELDVTLDALDLRS